MKKIVMVLIAIAVVFIVGASTKAENFVLLNADAARNTVTNAVVVPAICVKDWPPQQLSDGTYSISFDRKRGPKGPCDRNAHGQIAAYGSHDAKAVLTNGFPGTIILTDDGRVFRENIEINPVLKSTTSTEAKVDGYGKATLSDLAIIKDDNKVLNENIVATNNNVKQVESKVDATYDVVLAIGSRDERVAACKKKVNPYFTYDEGAVTVNGGVDALCKGDCKKGKAITSTIASILQIETQRKLNACDSIQ